MKCRSMALLVALGAIALAACSDATSPARPCVGVTLSPAPAATIVAKDSLATNVYDTLTFDPSISVTDEIRRDPIVPRTVTGHATVLAHLVLGGSQVPANVVPLILFVRGNSAGADTLVVTTRITSRSCPDGAQLRIPLTVLPVGAGR